MRPPIFAALLLASALLAPVTARADYERIESSVTLSLTLTRSGPQQTDDSSDGFTKASVGFERQRVGNAQIISAMHASGRIEEIRGWKLIALWGYWSDSVGEGYGCRFYLRRGSGATTELISVPTDLLLLAPITGINAHTVHFTADEDIRSGSEKAEGIQRLTCETADFYFNVNGLLVGSGRYVRFSDSGEIRYLPGAIKGSLRGLHNIPVPGDEESVRHGIAEGSISLGAATRVVIRENTDGTIIGVDTSVSVSVN